MTRSFELNQVQILHGLLKRKSKYMKMNRGLYHGSTPAQAASKAFTQMCKINKKQKSKCQAIVTVKETTPGSSGKLNSYKMTRVYDPVTVDVSGKKVTFKFKKTQEKA